MENKVFKVISETILNDPRISLKAKGLYVFIQSIDNYNKFLSTEFIASKNKESIDAVKSGIGELEHFGLLTREKVKDDRGYFKVNYIIHEII